MTPHDASTPPSDALDGYAKSAFTSSTGATHDVYRIGEGPAVIVIHEVPGITPLVAAFGRRIANRSMTAVLPDLFGTAGRPATMGYVMSTMARVCVRREFTGLATNKTSPIVEYLRELAHYEHEAHGGPGVGAVGMCLTGGFALAMCVDATVVAPVLSQPSLPLPIGSVRSSALGLSDADLHVVKRRLDDNLCVMGLRFSGDKKSPAARFDRLRKVLGDNFIGVEIDSSADNPWGIRSGAHSVLTEDLVDEPGSPTKAALDGVLDFFAQRLGVDPSP
jgi:dienelactone hydrolase